MSKVYIISGAGLSAESGIPTFRTGDGALWDNFPLEEVCYLPNFEEYYEVSHEFYRTRIQMFADKKPNAGHLMIADWEKQYGADRVINLTTNVDLLLEDAGCTNVHHIHGRVDEVIRNFDFITCMGSHSEKWGDLTVESCKEKGEYIKPNVVFFGEGVNYYADGIKPLYQHMMNVLTDIGDDDIVIVVGSSNQVVQFDQMLSSVKGTKILVNPDRDVIDAAICSRVYDLRLNLTVVDSVEQLNAIINDKMK